MKEVQEWLGHSDYSTTANIYAHLDYSSKVSSAHATSSCLHLYRNVKQEKDPVDSKSELTSLSEIPMAGLEPASLTAPHFECGVSANSTTSAN